MHDVNCPYCGEEIDIDHEDGYGYQEDTTHQQECEHCGKTFTYTTAVTFSYEAEKADCLNDEAPHQYKLSNTSPRECSVLRCTVCDDEVQLPPTIRRVLRNMGLSGASLPEIEKQLEELLSK